MYIYLLFFYVIRILVLVGPPSPKSRVGLPITPTCVKNRFLKRYYLIVMCVPISLLLIGDRSVILPSFSVLSVPSYSALSVGLPPYCRSFGLPLPLLCIVGRSIYLQVSSVLSVGLPESTYLLHIISRSPRLLPPPCVSVCRLTWSPSLLRSPHCRLSVSLDTFFLLHFLIRLVFLPPPYCCIFGRLVSLSQPTDGTQVGHSPFLLRIVGQSPSLRIVGRSTYLLRIVGRSPFLPTPYCRSVGLRTQ